METLNPPLVVIVGETASGKSWLAMELAKRFNGEIIAADAWTVRRRLNIGTAKPSLAQRSNIQHHLIDVVEPCQDFTAAVFKKMADSAIADIAGRGKLPIMVGGTGLYIDAVLFDYGFLEAGDRNQRQLLNDQTVDQLLQTAHNLGLSTAAIDERNKRRIIRLIEARGQLPKRSTLRKPTLVLGMQVDRDELTRRITKRVDDMLAAELELEVRALVKEFGWGCEALKGIGYVEWREYSEGSINKDEVRARIINSTKRLAKKQRTWFKRNNSIQWVSDLNQAVDNTTTFLNNNT